MTPQKKKVITREDATEVYFKVKALYGNPYTDSDAEMQEAIRIILEALTMRETTENEMLVKASELKAMVDRPMFNNRFGVMVKNRFWMLSTDPGMMIIAKTFNPREQED